MRKLLGNSFLASVAAGVIAFSASPALAATWTVSGGPNFTATSTNVSFKDTTTSQPFTCTGSTLSGTAPSGTGLSGTGIANFNSGSFTGCTGNLGSTATASLSAGSFNALSYDASTATVTGNITGIIIVFVIHDLLGTCTVTAKGEVDNVVYRNGDGSLVLIQSGLLTVTSAVGSGCAGLIKAGDKIFWSGRYVLAPKIRITQP